MLDKPVVDGFVNSASLLYLPTTYRASALAQMEVLRKAKGYRTRWYLVPEDLEEPVKAFSQLEYQVRLQPGSYVWGLTFSAPFDETGLYAAIPSKFITVRITDDCTETSFFSDYAKGVQLEPVPGTAKRHPMLITPRLVGEPGTLSVEIYNSADVDIRCQLAILVAEPCVPPESMAQALIQSGYAEVLG
jgi:hypothetical protein